MSKKIGLLIEGGWAGANASNMTDQTSRQWQIKRLNCPNLEPKERLGPKQWGNKPMSKKIGLLIGGEWSWPPAFIGEVNRHHEDITAELVQLGGTRMAERVEYALIIDRIGLEVAYYRTFLKVALLSGTTVVNNPFWTIADDRFFGASLMTYLNILHPLTVALPSHSHSNGLGDDAMRNLVCPIPWEEHLSYLGGFPILLKPIWDGPTRCEYYIQSYEELWHTYNDTGTQCMMLQQYHKWDKYVRCICIGAEHIMPIKYDPRAHWLNRYVDEENYLTPSEREQVVSLALKINQALGYEINAIECGFKDGVLYATDFINPVPKFEISFLTPRYFDWVVKATADFAIKQVKNPQRQLQDARWGWLIDDQPKR